MSLRSELIQSIHSSYIDKGYPELTQQELEHYLNSVRFLRDSLLLSKTGFLLIEYKSWNYVHCSNSMEIAGFSPDEILKKGPAFLLSRINLHDLQPQKIIHPMITDYFTALPEKEKSGHKFCFTFRFRRADDKEIMILQNNIFVKWDEQGKPVAKLIFFTDISDYKKDSHIVFYSSRIDQEGRNRVQIQRSFTPGHPVKLSPRQLEVVRLIEQGLHSHEIADTLRLSEETVRNMRKTIFHKLGCVNQAQMVKLASLYGLLRE